MREIKSAIACNLDADILSASLPLLEEERVEVLEWSFDTLFKIKEVPGWFDELLHAFSKEGRLIGHGVFFSLFSGRWLPEQQQWLQQLRSLSKRFSFEHITEHFGFMTGANFHHGAPLSIPYTASTLAIGRDRLSRIYDACECPVGLENLAFSYSLDEVKRHGEFLEKLIEPVNGFIILDLHNLYCQLHNFNLDFEELIQLYPLHRIREIHISGGSWEQSETDKDINVRRDTHDDAVPGEVFRLLEKAIPLCPQLKYVVMEQLGVGLKTEESRHGFYTDFLKMTEIISTNRQTEMSAAFQSFLPEKNLLPSDIAEDETLYQQQLLLSDILETSVTYDEAHERLLRSDLAQTAWNIEQWRPYMLETALAIAQKWKKVNT
jgi:uncharacterized protein (UPF0276 family)